MKELLKSKKITSGKDLTGLCTFFDIIELNAHSFRGLASLLTPIILEGNLKSELWDLDVILWLSNEELRT